MLRLRQSVLAGISSQRKTALCSTENTFFKTSINLQKMNKDLQTNTAQEPVLQKANVGRSVAKAKKIIADIYSLTGKHGSADWELNKATDAMYKFITEVERS